MAKSSIEWTEATWNPVSGCTRVSRGCDHCYAATLTKRLAAMGLEKYQGLINDGKTHFNGVVRVHPDTLEIPLECKKPTVFFVNSMSDLFHQQVPGEFVLDVFEVMARCPQHTFQILTKRPERMRTLVPEVLNQLPARLGRHYEHKRMPLPNVWLGTSVEDQPAVDERVNHLLETPAAVRFLSCEPLLDRIANLRLEGIDWVIVGGESGPGARPMQKSWVQEIKALCDQAHVPFFFKQWGGVHKKTNGRKLHGRTWDGMPDSRLKLSHEDKDRVHARLKTLRDRVSNTDDDIGQGTYIEQQQRLAEFGWLWKADVPILTDLFDRYQVA